MCCLHVGLALLSSLSLQLVLTTPMLECSKCTESSWRAALCTMASAETHETAIFAPRLANVMSIAVVSGGDRGAETTEYLRLLQSDVRALWTKYPQHAGRYSANGDASVSFVLRCSFSCCAGCAKSVFTLRAEVSHNSLLDLVSATVFLPCHTFNRIRLYASRLPLSPLHHRGQCWACLTERILKHGLAQRA